MIRTAAFGVTLAAAGLALSASAVPLTAQVPDVTRAPGELPEGEVRLASGLAPSGFISEQLRFDRVRLARSAKRAGLEAAFAELGLDFPPAGVYVRVFKAEREVEVWVRGRGSERYVRLRRYPICQVSGALGPKRQEGDRQMPEGFYEIESFNPQSDYHLSLRVDYPNASDRLLGRSERLGGDIYLHGGCSTVGCVPVTDDHIRELYWLSVEARSAGLRRIPVHIFPTRMDSIGMAWLEPFGETRADLSPFWEQLRAGYEFFERYRRVPGVIVEADGRYSVVDAGSPEGFSRVVRPAGGKRALLGTPVAEAAVRPPARGEAVEAAAVPVPALTGRQAAAAAGPALLGDPVEAGSAPPGSASTEPALAGARTGAATGGQAAPPRARQSSAEQDGPRLLGEPVEPPAAVEAAIPGAEDDPDERTTTEAGEWLTEEDLGEPRPPLIGKPLIIGEELEGGAAPPGAAPITLPGFEVRESKAIPGRMPYRPPRLRIVRPVI